jgi:putative membrane protein
METITRLLLTAVLVILLSHFIPGVLIDGVFSAIKVALVLALLNTFVKPILVFFSFPVTILTLGLFLLVINTLIIMICDHFLDGFKVQTFFTAFIFSIILSISQSILFRFAKNKK